jgi:hypothetical protein
MTAGKVVIAAGLAVLAGASALQPAKGVQRAAWLAGCWEAQSAQRTIEEQWMAPRGRTMLGMSRTVHGDSTVETEMVMLREEGERLAYEAHPSGQSAATFRSAGITDTSVVFDNPTHDFPQRIGYERRGADSLLAWIEGTMSGRNRRADFRYRRARCPS